MKLFSEWLIENNADGGKINQMFSQAAQEIDKLFKWLHSSLKKTLGGERGQIAIDDNAKEKAVRYLTTVLNILQNQGMPTESITRFENVIVEAENTISQLGLQGDEKGTYKAGDVLDAIKNRILRVLDQLRNDMILQNVGNLQKDITGVGKNVERLRSGEVNIRNDEIAKEGIQALLNKLIHQPNAKIYYQSASGRLVNLNSQIPGLNPGDEESLYSAIRLIRGGGSSRIYIGKDATDARSKNGKVVDLNNLGSVAATQGRLTPKMRLSY